jgi:predicted component of type VI protein secretion system
MTHPTQPLSGENLLVDDDDIILLTDEIPSEQNIDMVEICQLTDRTGTQEFQKLSETPKDEPAFIDLTDAIEPTDFKVELPPDFSVSEDDILNFDMEDTRFSDLQDLLSATPPSVASSASGVPQPSVTESPQDDLQRLINEVVHDSQVPPQDFSGIPPEITPLEVPSTATADRASLSPDQIDAAVERVVRNLFEERIEPVLNTLIATAVSREIENLKTIFLDYLTSRKTVFKSDE